MNPNQWANPPLTVKLKADEVHLWVTDLDLPPKTVESLTSFLNPQEIQKANRFRFPHHRHRYIVARSALRIILGRYLHLHPSEIEFNYSAKGKPSLANPKTQDLQFNMSHSETIALYGITSDCPIGVDIEHLRPMKDAIQLAQRFFCPSEYETIKRLTAENIENAFFKAWTAKEAFLKATGEGLGGGLDQIEIELNSEPIRFVSIAGEVNNIMNWSLVSVMPAESYLGAVVVPKKMNLQQFRLDLS